MLSLALTAEHDALAASVRGALQQHTLVSGPAPTGAWSALADLGVLGLGTDHVGGDATDLVVGMRAAGGVGFQGPLLGAVLAVRALDPARHGELLDGVVAGSAVAAITDGRVAPWASTADVLLEVRAGAEVLLVEASDVDPFDTLAREPWARVTTRAVESLGPRPLDLAAVALARAAWMVGAAETLLALGADHARDRRQFGRAIGDFQAVSHPLAAGAAELGAAIDSTILAAGCLEREGDPVPADRAARAAVRAALLVAYASHQAHGALGFTVERGLDRYSAGIRQLSLHPPELPHEVLAP